jgi:hypothetical protein
MELLALPSADEARLEFNFVRTDDGSPRWLLFVDGEEVDASKIPKLPI